MNPHRREFLQSAFGLSVLAAIPQRLFPEPPEPPPTPNPRPRIWKNMTLFTPVGLIRQFLNAFEPPEFDHWAPMAINHFKSFVYEKNRQELLDFVTLAMKALKQELFPHLGKETQLSIEHGVHIAQAGDYILWLPARPDLLAKVGEHEQICGKEAEFSSGFSLHGPLESEAVFDVATYHTESTLYYPIGGQLLGFAKDRSLIIQERKPASS